jgi:hypothetical protein
MTPTEFDSLCDMARLRGLDVRLYGSVGATSMGPYAVISNALPAAQGLESRVLEQRYTFERGFALLNKQYVGEEA